MLRYIFVLCIIGGDGLGFHVYDWRDMYICVGNDDSMWRISLKLFLSCFVFVLVWQGTHYWWWLSPLSRLVLRVETLVVVHQNVCLFMCLLICLCLFCLRWFSTYCCWYVYIYAWSEYTTPYIELFFIFRCSGFPPSSTVLTHQILQLFTLAYIYFNLQVAILSILRVYIDRPTNNKTISGNWNT